MQALGIGGVILFGLPETKDEWPRERTQRMESCRGPCARSNGHYRICWSMTDVCNCEYTSHGHCGKIVDGDVDNDADA